MPDIFEVLAKRWKLIATLTLAASLLALVISLLRPKEYLATVTALPANSAITDKARIFNTNIEALYPELGSPDELDRVEGTAKLDTIYLALAGELQLAAHYQIPSSPSAMFEAAMNLKKATDIRRSAYGELKIKVWDHNPLMAAQLANGLAQKLNDVYQHIQSANNSRVLQHLKSAMAQKQSQLDSLRLMRSAYDGTRLLNGSSSTFSSSDSLVPDLKRNTLHDDSRFSLLHEQIREYQKLINQYELALGTTLQLLVIVENARVPLSADKPQILTAVLFTLAASLIFSMLVAFFAESRNRGA